MSEPIMEFKTIEEAKACLKEWQKRLFLSDWIIDIKLCSPEEFKESNVCGENEFVMDSNCCVIRILKPEFYGERIVKYCAEQILIHELLHCKYCWISPPDGSLESVYYNTLEHSLLEQMAKSLFMAKYNLPFSWFENF